MKKRIAMFLLSVLCCFSVKAYDFEVDGIAYTVLYNNVVEVSGIADGSELNYITIPDRVYIDYDGYGIHHVVSIADNAFFDCHSLIDVTIQNGVSGIGNNAFQNCSSLAYIYIPNSVRNIGACAFWGCSGLLNITIPNSVTSIGGGAFEGCSSLTSISVEEGNVVLNVF